MNYKVSIIVPIFKAEKYIRKCIDSILAQTLKEFELILINDGSPDKSGSICDEYSNRDKRIHVIHKENGGVSSARQCGMNQAKGEYIIHVDPDDWIEPTMLEELYRKAKEDNYDMVICDFYANYTKTNQITYIKQTPSQLDSQTVLKELFTNLHGSCCNKLVRRQCLIEHQIEFPQEISFCEDLYVNAALLKHDIKVTYLPKAFYHYVQDINENSLVNSYNKDKVKTDKITENLFYNLLKNTDANTFCKKRFSYIIVHRAYISNCFNSHEFKQLFYEYRKEILNNPNIHLSYQLKLYLSCIGFHKFIKKFN